MTAAAGLYLSNDIETLRNDVLKAGVLNAKALQESAESHVANLGNALSPSPELDDASFQVMTSIIAFARLLYGQAQITESESARHHALTTIDRLAQIAGKVTSAGMPGAEASSERIAEAF